MGTVAVPGRLSVPRSDPRQKLIDDALEKPVIEGFLCDQELLVERTYQHLVGKSVIDARAQLASCLSSFECCICNLVALCPERGPGIVVLR